MQGKKTYLLGIDAGTTGLKSLLYDAKGKVIAGAYREYPLLHPTPEAAEQDPEDWWRALGETVREALSAGHVRPGSIAGLSVSSQGSTVVLLDDKLEVMRPAISWLDRRSQALGPDPAFSEKELFAITGLRAYPGWTSEFVRVLRVREPETLRRMRYLVTPGDYLTFRLTGTVAMDRSNAQRTRMFDVEKLAWSEPILESLGLSPAKLPVVGESGRIAGTVTRAAAAHTGLAEGTPVMLGGFDQNCCLLGAGAVNEDSMMVSLGTATMVGVTATSPIVDPERRVTTGCHVIPGRWSLQGPIMTTGAILRWYRDRFHSDPGEDFYRAMDAKAEAVDPGSQGLLCFPHFGGSGAPWWDPEMKGGFYGLTLAHEGVHVYRAILEGIAYDVRLIAEVFANLGLDVATVRIVGGGAVSALWCSIIGDVLGRPQTKAPQREVGTLGAAMLASVGAGVYDSVLAAAHAMTGEETFAAFDEDNHKTYTRHFERYVGLLGRTRTKPAPYPELAVLGRAAVKAEAVP